MGMGGGIQRAVWGCLPLMLALGACGDLRGGITDLEATRVSGPVNRIDTSLCTFAAPSPVLQRMLDAPDAWSAASAQADGVECKRWNNTYDEDGWTRRSVMRWDGDEGWSIEIVADRDALRMSDTLSVTLRPPEGANAAPISMASGTFRHLGRRVRKLETNGVTPGKGEENFMSQQVFDAEGRLLREERSTVQVASGEHNDESEEVLTYDDLGRPVTGRAVRNGERFDTQIRRWQPDGHGNPTRVLTVYRAEGGGAASPIQRAELAQYQYGYANEAR